MRLYRTAEEYLRDWPEGVSGGKGEGTAKAQLDSQNALQKQQLDFQNSIRDSITGTFGKYMTGNGEGFSPELKAALQSQFQNQTTQQFGQANDNVLSALKAKGYTGDLPVGGDYARSLSELEGAKANTLSSGTLNLGIQDLQQAITNKFNAGSLYQGQGAQLSSNINTFGQGANSALNQYVEAANKGFSNQFTSAFGSALGKSLGTVGYTPGGG